MVGREERLRWQGWALANLGELTRSVPEGWPEAYRSPVACEPLYHGDHATGLASIYATVNAIRMLDEHITPADVRHLLREGWAWFERRQVMRPDRSPRGGQWPRLIHALTQTHANRTGRTIFMDTPLRDWDERERYFDVALERHLVAGRVVLIMLSGANYVVVRGYTPHNLLLVDSGGRQWVRRQSAGGTLRPIPATMVTLSLRT
jgi:hypothetical protein